MVNPNVSIPRKPDGKFRVGDKVRIVEGGFRGAIAEVVEDRGNLGYQGRRLYHIRYRVDEWNENESVVGDDDIELVERPPPRGGKKTPIAPPRPPG